MTQLDTSIFRKYDIRGTVTGHNPQLTPAIARLVGQALGTYLPGAFSIEQVFVGSDNRLTSPPLKAALTEGLLSTGMDVTDIGEVLTPTTYFASSSTPNAAGVMITGSHLTTRYNGIKMAYGPLALFDAQIQALLSLIQSGDFAVGQGTLNTDYDMIYKHMETIKRKVTIRRPLTVVLDAGNGISGTVIPPVLKDLGIEVHCLYCESDGTYPNHLPNPEDPAMTVDLTKMVVDLGADLGLAFDGDSDRCGFIDNRGHHIAADRLLALLANDLLERQPGATIVFDVKCSLALPEEIKKHGGVPLMWKTGHSLMKQKMHEVGSPLGGEVSGHLFVGEDYYGFDDAPLIALKTLEIISKSNKTVAELFDAIPSLVATPEIILPTPDATKFQLIDEMTAALSKTNDVITLDGVRANFAHGWGLVRASNTQPAITLRFEAYERPQLVEYMERFKSLLKAHPEVDTTKLDEQIATFSGPASH